jgi:ribosomal protein S18 acetylase RimI-like enzyme
VREATGSSRQEARVAVRNPLADEYARVISDAAAWWPGRLPIQELVPSAFFRHFRDTSFIAERDGLLVGVLVGFLSQSEPGEAYIRFVCVHPDYRRRGIGASLYRYFFDAVRTRGPQLVSCATTADNDASLSFHRSLGFHIRAGDLDADGLSVHRDYAGPGAHRVILEKRL